MKPIVASLLKSFNFSDVFKTKGDLRRWSAKRTIGGILAMTASDLHWDNPKCDRKRLKKDLDYALEHDLDIFINGDLFCAMQGRYDGRRMKGDIREEHNTNTYLDSLVSTAVSWFEPYAKNIRLIGYGNHETAILKNCETDLLERLVDGLNARGADITLGGYGGWVVFVRCCMCALHATKKSTETEPKDGTLCGAHRRSHWAVTSWT